MKTAQLAQLLTWVGLVTATPTTWPRAVPSLDAAAFSEAQQRDDTATRAFTNTQIKVRLEIQAATPGSGWVMKNEIRD